MAKVLVIEDEEGMRDILKTYLEKNNFDVLFAEDGNAGIDMFKNNSFDIVLLDVMLPDISGWNILKTIRESSKIPVLMITARGEEYDKLLGFDLGADDYVVKPFSPREVIARIKAILSRANCTESNNVISFSGITIDIDSRNVKVDGKKIELTPKEFDLLSLLAKNMGKVVTREKCLNIVWGYEFFGDLRTVDTHIKQLREKLGEKRDIIKTVWGYGYKLGCD
ncbi:response regulator transcription factor [Thermoanaerobacterium thermosaccharolyticum]|jgi:two-component system, OmpR family, response regulator ResD|uniref:response regulator transcription factor n=1 Tax=Thermoanaerobacterium thermosaccharolyticum TaxID=1517 RepID=UPI001238766A|nr:response regulator transcription factor [Thermoanaerobacterium thermosaccharolyticum]KAA5807983.1 response regulator transcription factor [Thermoanaerobacterium thermosaccharolyticum]MBE0069331.1 response regulator transcription factor [Thermoanaerobacterium thermosaccharolyticum]MBE0229389.1 response regulator transcription factor [Thermoanaerobacterium thermosaccharolyticum]